MEFQSREVIIDQYIQTLQPLMEQYDLDNIGIYEEEGQGERYYLGYTIKKNDHEYMIHLPYKKDKQGKLAKERDDWVIESDDIDDLEVKGLTSLEDVMKKIENDIIH